MLIIGCDFHSRFEQIVQLIGRALPSLETEKGVRKKNHGLKETTASMAGGSTTISGF
jgi:hypothetical protein